MVILLGVITGFTVMVSSLLFYGLLVLWHPVLVVLLLITRFGFIVIYTICKYSILSVIRLITLMLTFEIIIITVVVILVFLGLTILLY